MVNKNTQKGGNVGYSTRLDPIGGNPVYQGYTTSMMPIYPGELLNNSDFNEGTLTEDLQYFNLIKGGSKKKIMKGGGPTRMNPLGQFYAIKKISLLLVKLSVSELATLVTLIILYLMNRNSEKDCLSRSEKLKRIRGYFNDFKNTMITLGKNNLIVLSSLLLLHYFAIRNQNKYEARSREKAPVKIILIKKKPEIRKGDLLYESLNNILAPSGHNEIGKSKILLALEKAFAHKKGVQIGGNSIGSLIAPLGANAFVATGLVVLLEQIIKKKFSSIVTKKAENKKKYGGLLKKKINKLNDILAPISFSTFLDKIKISNNNNNEK